MKNQKRSKHELYYRKKTNLLLKIKLTLRRHVSSDLILTKPQSKSLFYHTVKTLLFHLDWVGEPVYHLVSSFFYLCHVERDWRLSSNYCWQIRGLGIFFSFFSLFFLFVFFLRFFHFSLSHFPPLNLKFRNEVFYNANLIFCFFPMLSLDLWKANRNCLYT